MDKMVIKGGIPLKGKVKVGGAKNAALPILFAAVLSEEKSRIQNVPVLQDISSTLLLLNHLGAPTSFDIEKHEVVIEGAGISKAAHYDAPYDLVRKMRASVVVLGPLLARYGRARVSLPGGCAIGARPINYHLSGLEKLGAKIELEQGYVVAHASRLQGARVAFEFPSVGATENVLMAATLAHGESILENCAKEPEIVDLARALRSMGAEIEGEGSEIIRVQGRNALSGLSHSVMGDRIEAGTYLAAGLGTKGCVTVEGVTPECLEAVLAKFEQMGALVNRGGNSIEVKWEKDLVSVDVTTQPFPGFPTDMQAQFMALLALTSGASVVTETIFENRFMHVPELVRMGADITIRGNTALVRGGAQLVGAPVMATDLRASASLIIAGLCAKGETVVNRLYHLDRGYEQLDKKLISLGAQVERLKS